MRTSGEPKRLLRCWVCCVARAVRPLHRRIDYTGASNVMQWYGQRLGGAIEEEDVQRGPPISPHWRQQNPNCGLESSHNDGGNGDLSVADLECGGPSNRSAGGTGTMEGARDPHCAVRGGCGEGDNNAVSRSLEKVLAKQSTKQSRRPSKEHVDLLERGAALKRRIFGPQSSAARKALRDTIVACNSLAMSALGRGNTERCRDLLTRAFEIASDRQMRGQGIGGRIRKDDNAAENGGGGDPVLQILTLNNTACLHRRLGEPKRALRCLRRAAELGRRSGGSEHLEVTHLNACAVLSELGRHEEALGHARSAVYYGQELEEAGTREGAAEDGWEARLSSSSGAGNGSRRTRLATLAISYYNLAVELEYTHRYESCLRWYNEAVKLARDPDVHNEELIKTFQRSYASARKKHAPPYQPSRSSGFRKASTAKGGTPSRTHQEKNLDGASPAPFRVLRPLHDGGPQFSDGSEAAGSPGSSSTAREVGNGQHRRMLPEGGFGGDVGMREHDRRADWPVFGRAERQRASDERRSNSYRDTEPQRVFRQSAALSPSGNTQSDALLRPQPHSRHPRDEAFRAAANNAHNRPMGTAVRMRPASGSAAGRGSGPDSTLPPRLSRKRPASADIVRERDRRLSGRLRLNRVSESPFKPAVAESTRSRQQQQQQQQQIPRERCRAFLQSPTVNPERKWGHEMVEAGTVGQEGRRPTHHSRRPKSAYPRLEDGGGRPCDSSGVGTGAEGGKSLASSSRVGRVRSLSARALKASASAPSPWTSDQRDGWDRECHSLREEREGEELALTSEGENCGREGGEEKEREEVGRVAERDACDGSSPSRQVQGDAMTTTPTPTTTMAGHMLRRPHSDDGDTSANNDVGPSGNRNDHAVSPSAPATDNGVPRGGKPSIISPQSPQSKTTTSPAGACGPATQVVSTSAAAAPSSSPSAGATERARKPTKRPVIARSSPSRTRRGGSPRGTRQRKINSANGKEHHRYRAQDARPDNGRDGKLYVDIGTDGGLRQKPTRSGSASDHNDVNPRFDNGRDGKLYVEPDNGRDGKLYRELEDDEEQSSDAVKEAQPSETAPRKPNAVENHTVRNRRGLEADGIGTTKEPIRHESGDESNPPERRAEAASTIQSAIASAAFRRRSSGQGHGAKKTGETLPGKDLLDPARDNGRGLLERESDVTQRKSERVGETDVADAAVQMGASESAVQTRRKLAREAANRHVLAASTIRAWVARTCLARRLRRRKCVRDDLKRRWEPEIQRIATTRIQAVARGAMGRRARWRAERAAVDIQRVERGWRGRAAANELARTRLEERRSSCETIQRVFRGHRGRQKALRSTQITWEETLARQRAAGVLQSAWRNRPNRRISQEQQQQQFRGDSASAPVEQVERGDSASLAASSMTPTAGTEDNPSIEPPDAMPRQQLLRGAEAHGAVYAVWGGFTSVLTAAATRRAVRRAVEQALLSPAAATLAIFNRSCRNGVTAADFESSSSSSPPRARTAAVPPDPASFECAPRFKRDMAIAVRRMAGTVLARASSLSGVRAAARELSDGAICGSKGGDLGSGSGVEDDEGHRGWRAAAEIVEDEAVALVSEVAEECWTFLSSSHSSPLACLDDRVISERLTEILSDTLQGLIGNLGRICSSPSHYESIVLPMVLVRALSSSATASLLSHPDVAELVGLGREEDGEEDDDDGVTALSGGRGNDELGLVVAEVYCSLLSVSDSGGGGAENDQHAENNSDAKEESDAIGEPGKESKPPPPSVQVRADERLHFFRLFTDLIHVTAEELMCGMGMSGWHYNDVVMRMVTGLWEIAREGLTPSAVDDAQGEQEEFSTPSPWTKQELQGKSTGMEADHLDPADDTTTVRDGAADGASPSPTSDGEGKTRPIDTDSRSSGSSRCTDAPSSRASEREGSAAIDDSPAVAKEPTQDDAVTTPRTLRANACLSCSTDLVEAVLDSVVV